MRILELEIENIRGITHLILQPQGNNLVIRGPNGSGKSAVVDAIDFLLTGSIARLTGKGTATLSLDKHGHHIDHDSAEAKVRAIIKLNGTVEPIEISRCMQSPGKLIFEKKHQAALEPVLRLARQGHHVLTRREILKYITAEGGTRAEQIQDLLNISEVENIRKALVSVLNGFLKDLQSARQSATAAEGAVAATLGLPKYNVEAGLKVVNQYRAVFGKPPVTELRSAAIKTGLVLPPAISGTQAVNVTLIQHDVDVLISALGAQSQAALAEIDLTLRGLLIQLRTDAETLRALRVQKLLSLGIDLLDDSESCPLCETPWPEGELRTFLERRLNSAQAAQQLTTAIEDLVQQLHTHIATPLASLKKLIAVSELLDLVEERRILQGWEQDLRALLEELASPIDTYPSGRIPTESVIRLMAPRLAPDSLTQIKTTVQAKYPTATPEQTAWDTLTRLEENLKALELARRNLDRCQLQHRRADTLVTQFGCARDAILQTLYDEVSGKFMELYKAVHGDDEGDFSAALAPRGPALDFAVDFHGRGMHPAHALHSEGHQDSMGLCLYLALAEHLASGVLELVVLDDVVMSVDADHRRQICHLLASALPHRQFLITTHDRTWANQLKTEGVLKSKGLVEFYGWSIDTGPQVNAEADLWDLIQRDLERNDVSAAAAKLRRGAEEYFSTVCDALHAPVRFRLDGRSELGDLLPAAITQQRSLLKSAKVAANSWNQKERVEQLSEFNSVASSIYDRTNVEQWAVNASVHYNNWANLAPADFAPVVEAFQDLFDLFQCHTCGSTLYVTLSGATFTAVRCNCGAINWNLVSKNK